jgi:prevent-host-death family protein
MDPESDRWIRSDEARSKLRAVLDEVEHDQAHVWVLRYNRPAAVIVPAGWYEQAKKTITGEAS